MPRIDARLEFADNYLGRFRQYQTLAKRRMEAAALIATHDASRTALDTIRDKMRGAGLGRLGQALGQMSDMQRGKVHRRGEGFSASGTVYIRSGSARSRGAIEAYTKGVEIRPVRSRWLWIPTDEIPRVTGKRRMTPELYRKNGFEQKIGPLTQIRSVNGNPLLIARNVGVSAAGLPRKAKSLKKSGQPRKNQRLKQFLVAFIGIPRTSRSARLDVRAIVEAEQKRLPAYFEEAIQRTLD